MKSIVNSIFFWGISNVDGSNGGLSCCSGASQPVPLLNITKGIASPPIRVGSSAIGMVTLKPVFVLFQKRFTTVPPVGTTVPVVSGNGGVISHLTLDSPDVVPSLPA